MIECNAVITSATISSADHGCLSSWIHLDYGDSSGQGFGGYALYLPKDFRHHSIVSHAGHWLYRVMEIAGVEDWKNVPGRTIRVRKTDEFGSIIEIGHIVEDKWFNPKVEFESRKCAPTA